MKKECQVCGGPVSNGRCKLCGMPYRNDEVLYHLNENRRDHYKHATLRARIMMEDEERPLGDPKPEKTAAAGRNAASGRSTVTEKSTVSGRSTVQGKTAAGRKAVTGAKMTSGRNTGMSQTVRRSTLSGKRIPAQGRRRGITNILWLVVLLIIVCAVPIVLNESWNRTGTEYQRIEDASSDDFPTDAPVLTLTGDDAAVKVGTDLEAGYYTFIVSEGYANIRVEHNGKSILYGMSQNTSRNFYLTDGDRIWLEKSSDETDSEYTEIQIWQN